MNSTYNSLVGASIVAGYMDNGKLKGENTAPSLPEDKGWFHGSAGVK